MTVETVGPIRFAYVPSGSFAGMSVSAFHHAQQADITSCTLAKRRRERTLAYALVNALFQSPLLISHHSDGSPYLTDMDLRPVERFFSLSHCNGYVAVAEAPFPIGIDVEDPSPKIERVSRKFLSSAERSFIVSPDSMLVAWTIKEAVYKAALTPGLPLASGITIFSSGLMPEGEETVMSVDGFSRFFRSESRMLEGGSVLTVAWERCHSFTP